MDAMREEVRRQEQVDDEVQDTMSQVRYEISYHRPENKYHWKPEMKNNVCTSKGRFLI